MVDLIKKKAQLKFDTPISSIRDRIKIVKKIDNKTIEINMNTEKLKNKNPKIVISTE